uniref:Integrase catalytic domain-containing protein n=1 Tax=Caenorhabditis japonica TaxID=281687 RepID=A0A8R1DNL3_CAEJA
MTIPRLELTALETSTNCAVFLTQQLHNLIPFESVELFCDSMIALGWTTTHKTLKCFVKHRVDKIKQNCKIIEDKNIRHNLHHVPTDLNPADFTTRGKNTTDLFESELWSKGPKFLQQPREYWPQIWTNSTLIPKWLSSAITEEVVGKEGKLIYSKTEGINEYVVNLTTSSANDPTVYVSNVPFEAVESLSELIEIVQKQFAENAQTKQLDCNDKIKNLYTTATPGIAGHKQRRKAVLYYIIIEHYKEATTQLNSRIAQDMKPMQDQYGLIRHGTRLENSALPQQTIYPIILVREHKLAELATREIHTKNRHIGVEQTVTEIRREYWIQAARQLTRRVINSCTECRKLTGRPFRYPDIPPLPDYRVRKSRPFQNIGLDYFGPLTYLGTSGPQKCWILICTCLVTRNIHLELVSNNGTLEFMLAMRRFFSRRGTPKTVILDNAKTFKLGEKIFNSDIRRLAEEDKAIGTFLDNHPMDWKFITPLSPWKGGIYERLIGIVKKLLYSSGGTGQFKFVELFTIITEIEAIVNSRPISYNTETQDANVPVRPVDFIQPEVTLSVHQNVDILEAMKHPGLTERLTREHLASINNHLAELWKQWEDLYLMQLKEAKTKSKHYTRATPKVGQLVLVEEKLTSRYKWPLARITKLHPDPSTGDIRTVSIVIEKSNLEVLRSVNQLIPLELDEATQNENSNQNSKNCTKPTEPTESSDSKPKEISNLVKKSAKNQQKSNRSYLPRKAKEGITYYNCDTSH